MTAKHRSRSEELSHRLIHAGAGALEHAASILAKRPELSVITFAVGVELTLKARVAHEHWHLIVDDNSGRDSELWGRLQKGCAQTLGFKKSMRTLERILLPGEHKALQRSARSLESLNELRNQAVHFGLSADDSDGSLLAASQLRAWHALRSLSDSWPLELQRLAFREWHRIDASLSALADFLDSKAEELLPHLKADQDEGWAVGACPRCGHVGLASNQPEPLQSAMCRICESSSIAASGECSRCQKPVLAPIFGGKDRLFVTCPGCTQNHDVESIGRVALVVKRTRPGHPDEDRRILCGECGYGETTHLRVEGRDVFVCESCETPWFVDFDSHQTCDNCDETWVGANLNDSMFLGCPMCIDAIRDRNDRR